MSDRDELLARLSDLVGIADGYHGQTGEYVETSPESRQAVLDGFGLPTATEGEARDSLARVEALRCGLIPPLPIVIPEQPGGIPVRGPGTGDVEWHLTDEAGQVREGRSAIENGRFTLPPMPAGYYALEASCGGAKGSATLIAAPPRCWTPAEIADGAKLWGVTAQVYGLTSPRNMGIGDFTDIADAAAGSGALGASFLGLSPLHALFAADRTKFSPYSPSSRLFLESLYIDPTAIEGFEGSKAASLYGSERYADEVAKLRGATLVDHEAVWAVKRPLLHALFEDFSARGENAGFNAFRHEQGEQLELHATFEALSEHFRAEGRWWTGDWPQDFQSPQSEVVGFFRQEKRDEIAFHGWLQWQADMQLASASSRARESGMRIGLYRDLAVGADRGGSEVWAAPDRFSSTLSIGAPPDPLGPQGQNWGLPPVDPLALERQGLAAFRALVTANMRHAGAIRIDHAFQLQRLFLIPAGGTAAQGAYVEYPFEAMLAVLRLESHRNNCLVIAEDLGTGPEGFSDAIMRAGLLSYRVLFFEREPDGGIKKPEAYPRDALSVFTTHDLPTLRGWWRGLDVDLRQTLAVFDQEASEHERERRRQEVGQFCEALVEQGLLGDPNPPAEPPLEACVRYLARTSSVLTSIQFEDAAGELNQANLPGLDKGHPNWQRRLSTDVEHLVAPGSQLAKLAAALTEEGRAARPRASGLSVPPPRATYRLQFHKDFTFDHAVKIVPYLKRLGISHVYASPIAQARPGSTHGYDIVDHSRINTELGGEEGFIRLSDTLKAHDLGLILDIVPNHMGVGGADNAAWLSVLEWGQASPVADTFDIDWRRLGADGKLIVPFLGSRYGEALEAGELKLSFDADKGEFAVWHWEHKLPICPLNYPGILDRALAALGDGHEAGRDELLAVSERLRSMAEDPSAERRSGFHEEAEGLKRRIAAAAVSAGVREAIERAVAMVNGQPGSPESFGGLHRLLEEQNYRVAHWRVAATDINYRRFFDINSLGGIRVEKPEVFERSHELIFRLVREDRIQGLRIDHIDGLADPEGYARALQEAVGPGFYVVVEKILEPGEDLRPWPVAGTTGYDVLNQIDGVFVDERNESRFDAIYKDISGLDAGYGSQLRAAKEEIVETAFASELGVLVSDLKRVADADRKTRDYPVLAILRALVEIIARFPVYRTYIGPEGDPEPADAELLARTLRQAKRWSSLPDRSVHDFIASALTGEIDTSGPGRPAAQDVARFRRRFQQLTGPVMAKSVEDTLFYRYARLISLNEVGGDPDHFGIPVEKFHALNEARSKNWPNAMIATATHDTKRGEDARARLNALSELPDEWARALDHWREVATGILGKIDGEDVPDGNDQAMFLQTLLGAWPLELMEGDDAEMVDAFRDRIKTYAEKALREAKRFTSWVNVDEEYEKAVADFLDELLIPGGDFMSEFRPLAKRLAWLGALNGLSRTVLKCTLPGVPDIYQGTEFWDFSLVDPDNRRPVDYPEREATLAKGKMPDELLGDWTSGAVKQALIARLLADRAAAPMLYSEGGYSALTAKGAKAEHVIAYLRVSGQDALAVAVPRLVAGLVEGDTHPPGASVWEDTAIPVPAGKWRDLVTGRTVESEGLIAAGELFSAFPAAVLRKVP